MRRDRQGEILVAVVVTIAMAFALVFSILLSLGNDDPSATATPDRILPPDQTEAVSQIFTQIPTELVEVNLTPLVTEFITESPIETITLTSLPDDTSTLEATATQTIIASLTQTSSPTDTPTLEPTATRTIIPSLTRTHTPTNTLTPEPTSTPSLTRTPTSTDTLTLEPTATWTASPTPTRTASPSLTPFGQARTPIRSATPNPIDQARLEALTASPTFVERVTTTPRPSLTVVALQVSPTIAETIAPTPPPCSPLTEGESYRVDINETLFRIARRFEVSIMALAVANCISNPRLIYAGQLLYIPPADLNPILGVAGCENSGALIIQPQAGSRVQFPVNISGVAKGQVYQLAWQPDATNGVYEIFAEVEKNITAETRLGEWAIENLPSGYYWLRLQVFNADNNLAGECAVRVFVD